ncbi:Glyoxalase/bleomycin resistance protein/dioxygenase [Yersinia aldovae ATCC 35236]|nr:VOC family protein [Yersinia aldovae]EEP96488.1 Glyoxalase/bleomycin resistance protein/dioxygenase [Yersinia aldovae ATCC 35236]
MGVQGSDRQIDNIEFAVSDIARSKAFYGAVLTGVLPIMGRSIVSLLMAD